MKYRCVAIGLTIALAASAAHADPPAVKDGPDPAAAQTLFYEARNLMKAGKFSEACPKLEESLRLDEGIGTRFNLADCEEHLGRVATAWAGFLEVAGKARASHQPDREKIARDRAAKIEPRLPKLVVDVEGAPQGMEVKRDGVIVGHAAWGTAIPVDPGQHTIVATAPGKQAWETNVQTPEAKTTHVTIPVRDLQPIVAATPPAAAPPPAQPQPQPAPEPQGPTSQTQVTNADTMNGNFPPPEHDDRGGVQRTLGWVTLGLGAASLAVGGGFGIVSLGKRDAAGKHCNGDICDETSAQYREDAIRAGNVATATAIAGGAAAGLGIILLLTAPSSKEPSHAIRAVPNVAQGYGGVLIQGSLP